jgi:membrane protein YqaA with SNARE-associated domain
LGIVEGLLEWSREFFVPFGEAGLFAIAVAESSVFPVPPDMVLISLSLLNPALGLYYAAVSTAGSVLGGIAGYYIGLKGGRPLAGRFFSGKMLDRVDQYFKEYGSWAVLIAAFTPVPYKVFTITAGIARHDLKRFVLASAVGRGGRFLAEGVILMLWGEQLLEFLLQNFEVITLVIAGAIVGGLVVVKMRRRSHL